jgi:hypothetical protein
VYSNEWWLALVALLIIGLGTIAGARRVFKVPYSAAILAVGLTIPLPLMRVPGFETPIIVQDLVAISLAIGLLFRPVWRKEPTLALVAIAVLGWPFVSTVVGVFGSADPGLGWVVHIYRRVLIVVLFAAAVWGVYRRVYAIDFLDSVVISWIGMAAVGTLQYLGLFSVDIYGTAPWQQGAISVMESTQAQRGFLGLNRGAVGVWGSGIAAYSLARLFTRRQLTAGPLVIYSTAITLSLVVILFSGSRTGLLALAIASCYVLGVGQIGASKLGLVRMGVVLLSGLLAAYLLVIPGSTVVGSRLTGLADLSTVESVTARADIQRATIRRVGSDAGSLLWGHGPDPREFRARVDERFGHPHSEYVQILWESGLVGLLLYLSLITVLFGRSNSVRNDYSFALGTRAILIAGLVTGTGVGFLMITGERLAPYGMMLFFAYGLVFRPEDHGAGAVPAAESSLSITNKHRW